MRPWQVLSLWDRVDMGVIAMKSYSSFSKASGLDYQMQISIEFKTLIVVVGLTPLQSCWRCILQPIREVLLEETGSLE